MRAPRPTPVCFGFPGSDGSLASNAWGFVKLFHPSISIAFVHPLCPFSGKERFVVLICSVAFNFLWSAARGLADAARLRQSASRTPRHHARPSAARGR